MRKIEFKTCKRCKKIYLWESGGFVASPRDFMDGGMCAKCRKKASSRILQHILDAVRKEE